MESKVEINSVIQPYIIEIIKYYEWKKYCQILFTRSKLEGGM